MVLRQSVSLLFTHIRAAERKPAANSPTWFVPGVFNVAWRGNIRVCSLSRVRYLVGITKTGCVDLGHRSQRNWQRQYLPLVCSVPRRLGARC